MAGLQAVLVSALIFFTALPQTPAPEKKLFAYSVFYLFALFAVLVADRWLGA